VTVAHAAPPALVVLGAGGFCRNVLDTVDAVNKQRARYRLLGLLDRTEQLSPELTRRGSRLLGTDAAFADIDAHYVIAVADPGVRRRLDAYASGLGRTAGVLVHPASTMSEHSVPGPGMVVVAGARIASDVDCGRHVHVNFNATVGHDVRLGDYVTLHPQAAVSGDVVLGDGATVGSGAVILPGLTIGRNATVGAGAVVTADVTAGVTVIGVPARPLGTAGSGATAAAGPPSLPRPERSSTLAPSRTAASSSSRRL
jgi:sugar O-acyltransferase (sialic acid O-acetyltransferase NeuD family)